MYNCTYEACVLPMNKVNCSLFWINIRTFSLSSSVYGFLFFTKSSRVPLYFIVCSCTWVMVACMFLRVWANSLLLYYRRCRRTTALCMATNSSLSFHMVSPSDGTSTIIIILISPSARTSFSVVAQSCSAPFLEPCKSFASCSFLAIRYWTFDIVAPT